MFVLENCSHFRLYRYGSLLGLIPDVTTGVAVAVEPIAEFGDSVEALALEAATDSTFKVALIANGHLIALSEGDSTIDGGPVGFGRVRGLAYHPDTEVLYGVTFDTNRLLRFDDHTGQASLVASHVLEGHRLTDLAFHPDGRLFIVTADEPPQLFQVSPDTGKVVRKWTLQGGSGLESLLWSPDGKTLYSASQRGFYKDLCTIDLKRSRVRFVNKLHSGLDNIEGLAWWPYGWVGKPSPEPSGGQVAAAPARLRLEQNTPNPFNPSTRIDFELPQDAYTELHIVDVTGHRVATLWRGNAAAGRHEVTWNGRSERGDHVASGVYYYSLKSGTTTETRRMLLLK